MKTKSFFAAILLLISGFACAQVSGNIAVQNTAPTSTCSDTAACVEIPVADKGSLTLGVRGVYTGALSIQRSVDGATWETLTASNTVTDKAGTQTATVGSGVTGTFTLGNIIGFARVRVTALGAFTGVAIVNLQSSPAGGGTGSGGTSTAVTSADGALVTLGATTDAASAVGGTGTISAKLREVTTQLDTLNTSINANPAYLGTATAAVSISTATTTQIVALSGSTQVKVTSLSIIAGGTGNVTFVYGTGSACGTGTTALTGAYPLTAQSGLALGGGLGPVLITPAGQALCITTSAAIQVSGHVTYAQN